MLPGNPLRIVMHVCMYSPPIRYLAPPQAPVDTSQLSFWKMQDIFSVEEWVFNFCTLLSYLIFLSKNDFVIIQSKILFTVCSLKNHTRKMSAHIRRGQVATCLENPLFHGKLPKPCSLSIFTHM